MKLLLALNYKFVEKGAYPLVKFVEDNDLTKVVDGYEMMVDCKDEKEMSFLDELIHLAKEKDFIIQIHSSGYKDIVIQKEFLDKMEEYALFLERNLLIVYHPLSSDNKEDSLEDTNEMLGELLIYCYKNNYHLTLSLENLEHRKKEVRLDKNEIIPVLYNNIDLKYTYDLGHEFRDYGQITDVDKLLLERLSNVHLFRNDIDKVHLPLTDSDPDKNNWVKALLYLKQNGYDKSVVLEYDFYLMEGTTFDLKMLSYLKHASFIKEYL